MNENLNAGYEAEVVQPSDIVNTDGAADVLDMETDVNFVSEASGEAEVTEPHTQSGEESEEDRPMDTYKSFSSQEEYQAEIDRIIGKRLGDTRHLKEAADKYSDMAEKLRGFYSAETDDEALMRFNEQYQNAMAERMQMQPEQFAQYNEAQKKARQYDEMLRSQQENSQRQERISFIEGQVRELSQKIPDFDMNKEVSNPAFCELVWNKGVSVEDAYFLTHKDDFIKKAREDIVSNITAKQSRIPENGTGRSVPASARINPSKLTDKDIDDILDRVSKGEDITF